MSYQCPLCHHSLIFHARQWRCHQNHHFDQAKEGYVNLMPVQHKKSKQPGDSQEMVKARRAFLEQGFYQPLQDAVARLVIQYLPAQAANLLDIGCGEGYYTAVVGAQVQAQRQIEVFGLDIAKAAIRYAAKRYQHVQFCVASSYRLPFNDAALDTVLRIYAPCNPDELSRTIRPGGILLTVTPGARHLYQLKAAIYPQVQLHPPLTTALPGFICRSENQLSYMMELPGLQVANLLQMTPFAWHASVELKAQLQGTRQWRCETDFLIRVYQRDQ